MEDIFDQLLAGDANKSGDENPDDGDNENKDSGDDKEKKKRIAKVERRVFNKRPTLDVMRLTGPRGIGAIENMAKEIVLKGRGHEKEDLARIVTLLHYWTHRLYPKMTFEDCIEKIENLGKKRPTQTYLTKMRLGMIEVSDDTAAAEDSLSEAFDEPKQQVTTITDDQKERIVKNRTIAQARRAAKLQASNRPSCETINDP